MDFWKTDDSGTWQEESWSQTLHESLFKSVTPDEHVKKQRTKKKKKNNSDSQSLLTMEEKRKGSSSNEDGISDIEAVPRKKKKKGNVRDNNEDDVGRRNEVSPEKEKLVPKISSVSSAVGEQISATDVDIQSKLKTKKKRKRKARNNKFKVDTIEKEDEKHAIGPTQDNEVMENSVESSEPKLSRKERRKLKRKMTKQQLSTSKQHDSLKEIKEERQENSDDVEQSQISEKKTNSGESSELELSKKERRRLKRKMAKQQLRTSNQDSPKTEGKKLHENSHLSKLSQQSNVDGNGLVDEDEIKIPDASSHGDTSSNLILATTRRKTQLKNNISLKTQMETQLKSSQFRFLNEQLYKVTGDEAKGMFDSDPSAFLTYHEGFTQQVQQWPSNPVDIIIETLMKRPVSLVVGDFGCGDAKIARSVKQKVHSFDLYPINKYVTVCDVKRVPLKDGVLDVAVFCLSLMGTNWLDYIKEANRVLKPGGLLKVAEVASRFTSLASFLSTMKSSGFQLKAKDVSNKMFYLFDFKKKQVVKSVPNVNGTILKPCLYKKR